MIQLRKLSIYYWKKCHVIMKQTWLLHFVKYRLSIASFLENICIYNFRYISFGMYSNLACVEHLLNTLQLSLFIVLFIIWYYMFRLALFIRNSSSQLAVLYIYIYIWRQELYDDAWRYFEQYSEHIVSLVRSYDNVSHIYCHIICYWNTLSIYKLIYIHTYIYIYMCVCVFIT